MPPWRTPKVSEAAARSSRCHISGYTWHPTAPGEPTLAGSLYTSTHPLTAMLCHGKATRPHAVACAPGDPLQLQAPLTLLHSRALCQSCLEMSPQQDRPSHVALRQFLLWPKQFLLPANCITKWSCRGKTKAATTLLPSRDDRCKYKTSKAC